MKELGVSGSVESCQSELHLDPFTPLLLLGYHGRPSDKDLHIHGCSLCRIPSRNWILISASTILSAPIEFLLIIIQGTAIIFTTFKHRVYNFLPIFPPFSFSKSQQRFRSSRITTWRSWDQCHKCLSESTSPYTSSHSPHSTCTPQLEVPPIYPRSKSHWLSPWSSTVQNQKSLHQWASLSSPTGPYIRSILLLSWHLSHLGRMSPETARLSSTSFTLCRNYLSSLPTKMS